MEIGKEDKGVTGSLLKDQVILGFFSGRDKNGTDSTVLRRFL